jgi:uncharacterized protein (TIGR00369 family)
MRSQGDLHCGVIETLASIGAALVAQPRGQRVVGLENSTTFIRAVRSGKLHAVARPVTRGRSSQVWEGWIRDDKDQLVAQGRVRLLGIDGNKTLGVRCGRDGAITFERGQDLTYTSAASTAATSRAAYLCDIEAHSPRNL